MDLFSFFFFLIRVRFEFDVLSSKKGMIPNYGLDLVLFYFYYFFVPLSGHWADQEGVGYG